MIEEKKDLPHLDPLFAWAQGDFKQAFQTANVKDVRQAVKLLYQKKLEYQANPDAVWRNEKVLGPVSEAADDFFGNDPVNTEKDPHALYNHVLGLFTILCNADFEKQDVEEYLANELVPALKDKHGNFLDQKAREDAGATFMMVLNAVYSRK